MVADMTDIDPDAIDAAMTRAERACEARGETLTPPRRRILRRLLAVNRPMKAYDLLATSGEGDGRANPPTVYRALDFLCRAGLVHRIETDATFVACGHVEDGHGHAHGGVALLICESCGQASEAHLGPVDHALRDLAEAGGFSVSRLVVEARGLCAACAAGATP
jgi:Fur family zinc uptake transcriptional regulator